MQEKEKGRTNAVLLAQSDGCDVWQYRSESGDGTVARYDVFPGASLCFYDFHMESVCPYPAQRGELLAIDHCRAGRMEYASSEDTLACAAPGDVRIGRAGAGERLVFPTGHYCGLSVELALDDGAWAAQTQPEPLPESPAELARRFHAEKYPRILNPDVQMAHILGELYEAPEKVRLPYLRLKVLELMLCLASTEPPEEAQARPRFCRTQVEKVREIHAFLSENLSDNFTQEELAARFGIPLTTMKSCFKSLYGTSIGAWLTGCRMERAARLLREKAELSVAQIAGNVGYDSPSKFSMAFRRTRGVSPSECRREVR